MKKYISIVLILSTYTYANINDDYNTYKAQESYVNHDLKQSEIEYKKITSKTDEIKYNLANVLYKQKKYDEAISWYSEIASKDMKYKKHHNLGNAYAKLGKIDTAIKNYEKALEIQNDKDTKFNLELLKKKKEKEEQKKNKKKKKNSKDKKRKSNKDKDQKDDMDNEDKKDEKTSSNKKQDEIKEKKDNKSKNKDKAKNSKKEEIKKQDANITKEENLKNTDLSNLEEKKWSKMLNSRELNTLMIPLKNKGEKNDKNIKPW